MKKYITIAALLAAGTACANAASVGYNSMTDAQKEGVAFAWDFSNGEVGFAYGSVSMGGSGWPSDSFRLTDDNTATIGSSGTCPWSSQVTGVGADFTLSLDVNSVTNCNEWDSIVSLYSNGGSFNFNHCMALTTDGNGSNIILQNGLGGEISYGKAGNFGLTTGLVANGIADTTFTIVSDATNKTLTVYVNGAQVAQKTDWAPGEGGDFALTGFQFGSCFSEKDVIGSAEVSNITVWNKALSAKEVASLIPEPSAFGLLAGLGALALVASRRRRR